ncbi:MAG: hypothetical protein ACLRWP_09820 [Bilophila wadsworthia]
MVLGMVTVAMTGVFIGILIHYVEKAPRRDAEVSHVPIHRQRNPNRIP